MEKTTQKVEPKKVAQSGQNYFANADFGKIELTLENLLKSGAHFGHQKARRNPKMDPYIFTARKGINIIDLEKTKQKLEEAVEFLVKTKKDGGQILFVGTKPQARQLIKELAAFLDMPFVTERWLGGTFTNFSVIRKRVKYLIDSQEKMEKGEFKKYTKFEQLKKNEELEKLEKKMGGIKKMEKLPAAIFVTGVKEDQLAIAEARNAGVPIVAVVDTNNDPSAIDYPIPANDDAVSSLKYILSVVAKSLK